MSDEVECIRLRLTDEPGDVMLLTVDAGTTLTDEELDAAREFFLHVRELRRASDQGGAEEQM